MIKVHCKDNFRSEREYIYDVIFRDFWGIEYQIKYEDRSDVLIESNMGIRLAMADTFLQMPLDKWLSVASLPVQPLQHIIVPEEYVNCVTSVELPVIYGELAKELFSIDGTHCNLDIFGSALFMLTRYEEVVKNDRDYFDRFPATSSLAYQEGFLERPIINEYLEILWMWLSEHFVGLKRKEHCFSIMPTHDVDHPFWSMDVDWGNRIRMLIGDLLKRRNYKIFKKHLRYIIMAIRGNYEYDPYNTFDLIMDISDANNITSNFYFMTAQGRNGKDGNYNIMHLEIRKMVKNVLERGHKIGIHPGFGSKDKDDFIKNDVTKLWQLIAKEKLSVDHFGGRQHYLHWTAPATWSYYEEAGIVYDTTLSFADHIGFRCGICFDYPVYNVVTHERYKLREYPLEVMDCSGLSGQYMNLSYEEMVVRCRAIKEKVRKYQGVFVILWHNSSLIAKEDIGCYQNIIKG